MLITDLKFNSHIIARRAKKVKTLIRLLLKRMSDLGLHFLPRHFNSGICLQNFIEIPIIVLKSV